MSFLLLFFGFLVGLLAGAAFAAFIAHRVTTVMSNHHRAVLERLASQEDIDWARETLQLSEKLGRAVVGRHIWDRVGKWVDRT